MRSWAHMQVEGTLSITSQMIYHRGGEPEQAIHCWFNAMAHKPWITAEFVTVCSSMSVVSNTSCSHFFDQWSYWGYTHAFTKLHTKVMSCAYECRLCMRLTWSKLNCRAWFVLWAARPCLSWSAVAMRVLTWVVFIPWASFMLKLRSGSTLHRRDSGLGILHARTTWSSWNI